MMLKLEKKTIHANRGVGKTTKVVDTMQRSSTYPLYESIVASLSSTATTKDLTPAEKNFFCQAIKRVDATVRERVYLLIAVHFQKCDNVGADQLSLPFGGSYVKTGIMEFNFNKFPTALKHILFHFMKVHVEGHGAAADAAASK